MERVSTGLLMKSICCKVMSDFVTSWTAAHQALQSMAFPRQEYWSGLPFPSPGDLPDPGVEPTSPALAFGFLTAEKPGSPRDYLDDTLLCSTLCKAFILRKVFDSKIYKHKKSFSLGPGFLTLDKEGRFSTW